MIFSKAASALPSGSCPSGSSICHLVLDIWGQTCQPSPAESNNDQDLTRPPVFLDYFEQPQMGVSTLHCPVAEHLGDKRIPSSWALALFQPNTARLPDLALTTVN